MLGASILRIKSPDGKLSSRGLQTKPLRRNLVGISTCFALRYSHTFLPVNGVSTRCAQMVVWRLKLTQSIVSACSIVAAVQMI